MWFSNPVSAEREMRITKIFPAGLDVGEGGLENGPIVWRLAVETVRIPATKDVAAKAVVAVVDSTTDVKGTESAN